MTDRLLLSTDLDRTLLPNGPQPESPGCREQFARLVSRPEVSLVYVTGRHRELIEKSIRQYRLPLPDYVVADVGTTIYRLDADQQWQILQDWQQQIAKDWGGKSRAQIKGLLDGVEYLRMQEHAKQGAFKLSYYVPVYVDQYRLMQEIQSRLQPQGINARLVWSVDELLEIGLLDVLPERASKYHALRALIQAIGHDQDTTVFCGDSGNDLEVLVSPLPAVLVANSMPAVREEAIELARAAGNADQLYICKGGFQGMNGNYSAGMLEGIAHYYPDIIDWLKP
jgi:HAD superfamily hydrolase (TIGR01484 family)